MNSKQVAQFRKTVQTSLTTTADVLEALVYRDYKYHGTLNEKLAKRWLDMERLVAEL